MNVLVAVPPSVPGQSPTSAFVKPDFFCMLTPFPPEYNWPHAGKYPRHIRRIY